MKKTKLMVLLTLCLSLFILPKTCLAKVIYIDDIKYDVEATLEKESFSYDATSDLLILKNASLKNIKTEENLIIKLEGDNNINTTSSNSIDANFLTITGSGSLTINTKTNAIHCRKATIENITLNITTQKYIIFNVGDNSDIIINNAKFTFETPSYALINTGNLYINDSEILVKNAKSVMETNNGIYINNSKVIVEKCESFARYDAHKYYSGVVDVEIKSNSTNFYKNYIHLGSDIKAYHSTDGITYQELAFNKLEAKTTVGTYLKFKSSQDFVSKEKNQELEQKEQELLEKEKLLQEKEAELKKKEAELKALEEKLNEQEAKLNAKDADLDKKDKGLSEREQDLDQREENLIPKEDELKSLEEKLKKKEEELKTKELTLSKKEEELESYEDTLKTKEKELAELEESLTKEKGDLEQKQEELNNKEADLNQKDKVLDEKEENLNNKETDLNKRDEDLSAKDNTLQEQEENLNFWNKELEAKQLELKTLEDSLTNEKSSLDEEELVLKGYEESLIKKENELKRREDNLTLYAKNYCSSNQVSSNNIENPKTYDGIAISITILILSLVGIVLLILRRKWRING